jgi:hypothetical protein
MPWAKFDDKTPRHPKLLLLPRIDRWTWFEIICYCAEYRTQGAIPKTIAQAVPHAKQGFLQLATDVGLFESEGGSLSVHDFDKYNLKDLTATERKRRERARARDNGPVSDEDDIAFAREEDTNPRANPRAQPRRRRRGLSDEEIANL